jgi:hypothetical protein
LSVVATGFSSSDFWVFKTLCSLWFIGLCGFSLGFYGVFGGSKTGTKPHLHELIEDGIVGITTHQPRFVKAIQPFQVAIA